MSRLSRRGMMGSVAALIPAAAVASTTPGPDAAFIRLCDNHGRLKVAADTVDVDYDENHPVWAAYFASCDTITDAVPQTVAGVMAKARAAKVEAQQPDGREEWDGGPACTWAGQIVCDLLRLSGGRS